MPPKGHRAGRGEQAGLLDTARHRAARAHRSSLLWLWGAFSSRGLASGKEKGGSGTVPWWARRLRAMAGRREGAPQQ